MLNDSPIHLRKYSFFKPVDCTSDSVTVPVWLRQEDLDALNALIHFSEGMGQGKVPGSHDLVMFYRTIKDCLGKAETRHKATKWYPTESLCELCLKRISGCTFQFNSEQCLADRKHFLEK